MFNFKLFFIKKDLKMSYRDLLIIIINQNLFIHLNQYSTVDPIEYSKYLKVYYFTSLSYLNEYFVVISSNR
jgi:hypothetical protein